MLIVSILVFCIVLFLYLHVYFHLKKSNDLEVYEIDQPSKERLEEVCDIRQPTTFDFINEPLLQATSYQNVVQNYRAFDIKIRDVSKPKKKSSEKNNDDKDSDNDNSELYIPVSLKMANEAFQADTDEKYLSENNHEFVEETGLLKHFQTNDEFIRPYMVSNCDYDIMFASVNTKTPLRYELNYRNYFFVSQGKVKILLIPPKDGKYLFSEEDYYNFEFRSPVNPWNIQAEYQSEFEKLKTLEVELKQGMMMYIPAYWWYSIWFEEPQTSVCSFKYRTYMNTLSLLPKLMMKLLQNTNTKREIVRKHEFSFPSRKTDVAGSTTGQSIANDTSDKSIPMNLAMSSQINNNNNNNNNETDTGMTSVPHHGDQFLPSSLRNTSNPFSVTSINANVNSATPTTTPNTIESGNDSTITAQSTTFSPENTEIILTGDSIKT